ncbi:MAG TPA: hypothetical protein DCS43_06840 [Verrucomicrobia bacterium]|nr:hypothetical protein [Verrucomicrobiota bacterium]
MSLTISKQSNVLTCQFSGKMDTPTCTRIDAELTQALSTFDASADGALIAFDMADVDYVASVFLRFCVKAAKAAGPRKFVVTRITPSVRKIFKIAGLNDCLPAV